MKKDIPLIVPEVNPDDLSKFRKKLSPIPIVHNSNGTGIKTYPRSLQYKKIVVSTYQSTSGAGKVAMDNYFIKLWMFIKINP